MLYVLGRKSDFIATRRKGCSQRVHARASTESVFVLRFDPLAPSHLGLLCALVDISFNPSQHTVVIEVRHDERCLSSLDSSPFLSNFGINKPAPALISSKSRRSIDRSTSLVDLTLSVSNGGVEHVQAVHSEDTPQKCPTEVAEIIKEGEEQVIPDDLVERPHDDSCSIASYTASPVSSRRPSTPWSTHPADVAFIVDDEDEEQPSFYDDEDSGIFSPKLEFSEHTTEIVVEESEVPSLIHSEVVVDDLDDNDILETPEDEGAREYSEEDDDAPASDDKEGKADGEEEEEEYEPLEQTDGTPHEITNFADIQFSRTNTLGQGAYGAVFKGSVKGLHKLVAVKAIKKGVIHANLHTEFLLNEMDVMFWMKEERNYTKALGVFDSEIESIIVMPLYQNGSLLGLMKSCGGRFSEERSRFYCAQIVSPFSLLARLSSSYSPPAPGYRCSPQDVHCSPRHQA
ncbi:hypothetical protein HGRIS_003535 [Hohenbuehelia grisea]|uniref:non-specific serine/threonine protein kinase n=1 Tax=Hohenbuehelia grisea TaxID=104357 RepID=A0ABR3JFS0_9AGAR